MLVYIRPFEKMANTASLAVGTSTGSVAVPGSGVGNGTVRLTNSGTNIIFVEFGAATVTATTTTGIPLLPNSVETFVFRNENTHVAAIAGTAGNTLYITYGVGS